MHMTGFEHQMLNLRGLAYSYQVNILFDSSTNQITIQKKLPEKFGDLYFENFVNPDEYVNQIEFEEAIKEFLNDYKNEIDNLEEDCDDCCIN